MIPYCIDHGMAITPYSPLASGLLSRQPSDEASARSQKDTIQKLKYTDKSKQSDDAISEAVRAVAKARSVSPAQIALAWLLSKPGVTAPIIGATKQHHIEDAVKAVQLRLTEDEVKQIEASYTPHAVVGAT